MYKNHDKRITLGFFGDGQLARLGLLEAKKTYPNIVVYSLDKRNSPCEGLAEIVEGSSWNDEKAFQEFCAKVDVIILENEFVSPIFLKQAELSGTQIIPNASAYEAISDKLKQVKLAEELGIPIPQTQVVDTTSDLTGLKFPTMLKSLRGGYDGHGNLLLTSQDDLSKAQNFISKNGTSLAQEFISFQHEMAVLVIRNETSCHTFPVVETIQEDNVCHYVLTPPRLNPELQNLISEYAQRLISKINGVGLFGVEFFVKDGVVIFNEIAPRAHNSGHFSIEGCDYSQFEAILKIMRGETLSPPTLRFPACGMLNLLGTHSGKAEFKGDPSFTVLSHGFLHFYGKKESRPGRKMGHYTLLGSSSDEVMKTLSDLKTRYEI